MTLLRSLLVGLLAVAAARSISRLLSCRDRGVRHTAWILLLAPYFTPVLLTGYAYANFSLSLIHHPALNNGFYIALLWWKFTAIAAIILHFTPTPISAEAVYCWRLLSKSTLSRWRFLVRAGCTRGALAAFAVVFLCAFGEFEMASLMGINSWTVTLFDAHAGGLALNESVRRMIGPLACQATTVAITILVLAHHRVSPAPSVSNTRAMNGIGWAHLVMAFVFVIAIPAGVVLWGGVQGFGLLFENFVLGREILSSLLFAASATAIATIAVIALAGLARQSIWTRTALVTSVGAGLLGPLVLSIAVLAAIQFPGLLSLRDTPVPLAFTLALVLIPLALVLMRVLQLTGERSAAHLATLMPESRSRQELIWSLSTRGRFWAVAVLFGWAYWDLTASAILAPTGMTPVTVRLYNLMHYGQIAALSAMTCAAFLAPALILLLVLAMRRWWVPQ